MAAMLGQLDASGRRFVLRGVSDADARGRLDYLLESVASTSPPRPSVQRPLKGIREIDPDILAGLLLTPDILGLRVQQLTSELSCLAELLALSRWTAFVLHDDGFAVWPALFHAPPLRRALASLSSNIGVRRMRYNSPAEIALIVPAVIIGSKAALALLTFGLKRIYGLDLELRVHREELRAAFFDARTKAEQAEASWLAQQPVDLWPQEVLDAVVELAHARAADPSAQIAPGSVTLADDEQSGESATDVREG